MITYFGYTNWTDIGEIKKHMFWTFLSNNINPEFLINLVPLIASHSHKSCKITSAEDQAYNKQSLIICNPVMVLMSIKLYLVNLGWGIWHEINTAGLYNLHHKWRHSYVRKLKP